jgi:hypothetical protein
MFGSSIAIPNLVANIYGESSTVVAPPIQGGYTSLLLGLHQDVSAPQKLYFDESCYILGVVMFYENRTGWC